MRLLQGIARLFGRGQPQVPIGGPPVDPAPPERPAKTIDAPSDVSPGRIARVIFDETLAASEAWQADLSRSARWRRLKHDPPELQIAVLRAACARTYGLGSDRPRRVELQRAMASKLLRRNLPFTENDLLVLLEAWLRLGYVVPGGSLLSAVEQYAGGSELSLPVKRVLKRLSVRAEGRAGYFGEPSTKESRAHARRIARLLDPSSGEAVALPQGAFARRFDDLLASLPERDRAGWRALAALGVTAGDRSSPSRKWQAAAAGEMRERDLGQVRSALVRLLDETTPDPAQPDDSLDILKGLIWYSAQIEGLAEPVGRFAERCFRKIPKVGARSVKLGNAALWALSEIVDDPAAAAELFRLAQKIKRPTTQLAIGKRIAELARKRGQAVGEMEDACLPDYGLDMDGGARFSFGASRMELSLQATGLEQAWFNRSGSTVKTVPAEVRAHHAAELKICRRRVKDIGRARAAQVLRLEQSWLEGRRWRLSDWRTHFLSHPLRRPIVQALIWRIGSCDVLPIGDALTDLRGVAQRFPDDAEVSLWHPLHNSPERVLAWRQRILELAITQPIKQAHREIYVLTDAERRTGVYSNRFAAHILRQHQLRALCQARGWTYELMGSFDVHSVPARLVPGHELVVEYDVHVVDDGLDAGSGVALHVRSDQVRFVSVLSEAVALDDVPPVVFSEAMRDIDLFVAVTSVANDPAWADGGPQGPNRLYWSEWAFADLGQSATVRKELIAWIAPRLSIADRLEVADKFLIVQGKRQKYAIHFGSGNIQIRPSNRYLCIVPDGAPAEAARLKLPFEGDRVLSTILSKAFLLVDEDKIEDPTILRQL